MSNPFKIGDRVEQKDNYDGYTTQKGWKGTVYSAFLDSVKVNWDDFKEYPLLVKTNEIYLLQADGEKSVKEDASKDIHNKTVDEGWGF